MFTLFTKVIKENGSTVETIVKTERIIDVSQDTPDTSWVKWDEGSQTRSMVVLGSVTEIYEKLNYFMIR